MKSHWLKMGYWRWLWGRLPWEVRWVVLAALLLGLLGGGWVAASAATSNDGAEVAIGSNPIIIETTIQKVITVRKNGKIIRKIVPVVKRVKVLQRAGTVYETRREYVTQVVTGPEGPVTRTVSELVPVVTTRADHSERQAADRDQDAVPIDDANEDGPTHADARRDAKRHADPDPDGSAGHGHEDDDGVEDPDADEDPDASIRPRRSTRRKTETRTVTETQIVTVTPDAVTVTVTPDPVTVTRTETETVTVTVDSGGG